VGLWRKPLSDILEVFWDCVSKGKGSPLQDVPRPSLPSAGHIQELQSAPLDKSGHLCGFFRHLFENYIHKSGTAIQEKGNWMLCEFLSSILTTYLNWELLVSVAC
jgi:hypothetical protein